MKASLVDVAEKVGLGYFGLFTLSVFAVHMSH